MKEEGIGYDHRPPEITGQPGRVLKQDLSTLLAASPRPSTASVDR